MSFVAETTSLLLWHILVGVRQQAGCLHHHQTMTHCNACAVCCSDSWVRPIRSVHAAEPAAVCKPNSRPKGEWPCHGCDCNNIWCSHSQASICLPVQLRIKKTFRTHCAKGFTLDIPSACHMHIDLDCCLSGGLLPARPFAWTFRLLHGCGRCPTKSHD